MKRYFPLLLGVIFFGCQPKVTDNSHITIDVDKAISVSLDDKSAYLGDPIHLDYLDEKGLIANIDAFYSFDDCFLMLSNKRLIKFDKLTGKFIGNISGAGRGPGEYSGPIKVWKIDDEISIFDFNTSRVVIFDINNNFIKDNKINGGWGSNIFQDLFPFGEKGGFVGKMQFFGRPGVDPELAYYDSNYVYVQTIGDFKLTSGIRFSRQPFSRYGSEVLYWRTLNYDIWAIDKDLNFSKKYQLDFGKYNIPEGEYADEYNVIDFLNKRTQSYASILQGVQETKKYLMFSFKVGKGNEGEQYVEIYDKRSGKSNLFTFNGKNVMRVDFLPISENEVYLYAVIEDTNGVICKLNVDKLVAAYKRQNL